MKGSNISAKFTSPVTTNFRVGAKIPFVVEANAESGIMNVEIYMDGKSVGFAQRDGTSNAFVLNHDLSGIPEGEYSFSFIARDYNGNISGTFPNWVTTITARQNIIINIIPEGGFTPVILSPVKRYASAEALISSGGIISDIQVIDGGSGFRFPPM